jgi:protein kinase A
MPSLGFLKRKKTKDTESSSTAQDSIGSTTSSNNPSSAVSNGNQNIASVASPGATAAAASTASAQDTMPHHGDTTMTDAKPATKTYQPNASSQAVESKSELSARETKGKYNLVDFTIQRTLGTGSFGRVHLVQSKHNSRFYAVKVLKKNQVVKMKQVEHTNDERRMLAKVKHPFLITLWGTFQDSKNLYMVMDFIEGGELFSLLRKSQVRFSIQLHF